jgi:hypothetical protein
MPAPTAQWAEWIAWQLEDEGYQVVVQAWDFSPGRDWEHETPPPPPPPSGSLQWCRPPTSGRPMGRLEWHPFYVEDPSGERALLLSVRVGEVSHLGC